MRSELLELAIFFSLVTALAVLWYHMWVIPNDAFLNAVMDCMNDIGDHTEQGYRVCVEQIRG